MFWVFVTRLILSSKCSLKFCNLGKLSNLKKFITEYKNVVSKVIDILWDEEKIHSLVSKQYTSKISSWISARAIQCAAKQAAGIVKGVKSKQSKRLYQINKFLKEGEFKKAKKLKSIYDSAKISKPKIDNIECELDERFVKINITKINHFDIWVTLSSLGDKIKIHIPVQNHKHLKKMLEVGVIKKGVRVSCKEICFNFDVEPRKNNSKNILGLDIGKKSAISCSDSSVINKCPHGHDFESICKKLTRRKKGSKNFKKAQKHRSNYLRYVVNKINLNDIGQVNREDIKNLRKFKNVSRAMKHWNYSELFDVLDLRLEKAGVLLNKINPK